MIRINNIPAIIPIVKYNISEFLFPDVDGVSDVAKSWIIRVGFLTLVIFSRISSRFF
jgi:hypothetical protein